MHSSNLSQPVNLFVPIETKVRELHGKVLFSLYAANAGFRVIIGEQREVREQLPFRLPGIYVDKSVAQSKEKWFQRFSALGNTLVAWDEEGLIFHDGTYVEKRFSRDAFRLIKRFYAWGEHHEKEIKASVSEAGGKIITSGNPRFDMLQKEYRPFYKERVEKIRRQLGRFVLVNTNFGHVNHFAGPGYKEKIRKKGRGPEMEKFIREWRQFQQQIFSEFVRGVQRLAAKLEDIQLVVRPHPSENHDYWKDVTAEYGNVHVLHEGNVIEWILASECVVHNDCTTAVEAYLLNKPVIAFRPIQSEKFETFLPNFLSVTVPDIDGLVNAVLCKIGHLKGPDPSSHGQESKAQLQVAEYYISNMSGGTACCAIVNDLKSLVKDLSKPRQYFRLLASSPFRSYYHLLTLYRRFREGRKGALYARHKFDNLPLAEMERAVTNFIRIEPDFTGMQVRKLSDSCFTITKPV